MRKLVGLKPQDIIVLLKLLRPNNSQKQVADEIGISQAEVSHAIRRLQASRLLDSKGFVNRRSAAEFIVHGLKYVFPAVYGPVTLGTPTAYSHPQFRFVHYEPSEVVVWPDPEGTVRGQSMYPIYDSAVRAAKHDPELYELLSLIDMIRVGRAREVSLASEKLEEKLRTIE